MKVDRRAFLAAAVGVPVAAAAPDPFDWLEDDELRSAESAAALDTAADSCVICVVDGSFVAAGDVVIVPGTCGQEALLVEAVSAKTITIRRGICGTTPAAIRKGAKLVNIGPLPPPRYVSVTQIWETKA